MEDVSARTLTRGSLIEMKSLIQADKSVRDLQGLIEQRSESQKKSQHTNSALKKHEHPAIFSKLELFPKKPPVMPHQSNSPMSSSRRPYQTARDTDSNAEYTVLKAHRDEIKLLRLTVEQLTKERDSLLAQNTALLMASSETASGLNSNSESSKIRVLPESHTQSLGLYSCEMIDPMKRVPRSFRLRVHALHRKNSPTKTILSKPDRTTVANVADYSSEPAQRVAYTSGRLMAQYILNADANHHSRFHSLTAYCRSKLAHARQVDHRSSTSLHGQGRQALKAIVNPFTLATACECMKNLIEACPMYQDVMNEAFAEIMVGLYAPDTIHYNMTRDAPEFGSTAPADALLRHLQNIPYCELNRYIGADLFLAQQELKDSWSLAKRVLLVEDSLGMIIRKQLQTYQKFSRRFHFNAWLDVFHCRRIWRDTFITKATKTYRILHQSKAFCAWQACMDLADTEKKLADQTASMADEKRIIGGEIWNLQDQIKQCDLEVASLRLKMAEFTTLRDNALVWRKRSTDISGHIVAICTEYNVSEIRIPFPITSLFQMLPEEQNNLISQTPSSATIVRAVGGQTDTTQQQAHSGINRPGTGSSRPGTSSNSKSDTHHASRPGSSYRPGSAGQPPALEVIVARLLNSPVEEIIARMVFAGTGVIITGWSDKLMMSGLLHLKMLDFMQMQDYDTVPKDAESPVDVWTSVLSRAKQLGAVFHDSVTTPESLMAKSAVARCLLVADIVLNCGCPPISPLWTAFRQRFVTQETSDSMDNKLFAPYNRMQLLISSLECVQEICNREDVEEHESFEGFVKECPSICGASLNAYRDANELASCMRVLQEHLRRWFSTMSLKLGMS
jgi:hypothetical protein